MTFHYSSTTHSVNLTLKQTTRLRAFAAATLFLEKAPDVGTVAKAARLGRVSEPTMYAALRVLKTRDPDLIADVLSGDASLDGTATQLRNGESLLKAFKAASASDLAMLGTIIGADEVFDRVVVPAL